MILSKLNVLLEDRDISPEKLHELTGIPKATIRELLTQKADNIAFDELEGLCDFFNCSVGDLLEHTNP